MTDDESLLDLLRSTDPGDARYTPQSLLRVAKQRHRRIRIGVSAASCLAVATAAVLVTQIAPSGHPDRVDVVTTTQPPTAPTRVEAFGDPRLPVCFSRADLGTRLAEGAATPAPGSHQPTDGFPNVATSQAAIAHCADHWAQGILTEGGQPDPSRIHGGSRSIPPALFACAYRLPSGSGVGWRGNPPSTREVAVFPVFPNQPDSCADLGLNPLSQ
jgi:hypothetical protein